MYWGAIAHLCTPQPQEQHTNSSSRARPDTRDRHNHSAMLTTITITETAYTPQRMKCTTAHRHREHDSGSIGGEAQGNQKRQHRLPGVAQALSLHPHHRWRSAILAIPP